VKALSPANEIEALAAFVDGRLGPEDHAAVVARLAEDERYYELLSEVMAFREVELENEAVLPADLLPVASPPGTLERIRAFWSALWHAGPFAILIPVAATIVLALSWWFWAAQPPSSEVLLARALPSAKIVTSRDFDRPWGRKRGSGTKSVYLSDKKSTRAGVSIVDLHQALAIRHAPTAASAFSDIRVLCDPELYPAPVALENGVDDAYDWASAATALAKLEAFLAESADPQSFREAVLLRTAWFAASNGDRRFFDGKVERALAKLGIEVGTDLAGLAEVLEAELRERADLDPD
jgi:hypothetical protein